MLSDRVGMRLGSVLALGAVAIVASATLAVAMRSQVQRAGPTRDAAADAAGPIAVDFPSDIPAKQEMFNRGLPMKVDQYTVLQRVDHRKGYWNFHFLVSFYITRKQEFEEKKHASTISGLCMDKSFVQSLKDSGPFLYEYLDPSGQTADIVIPKDDCGD